MMHSARPAWLTHSPFAHRGLHDLVRGVPENTLPAFEASVSAGYGIELDVQQLGDGTLVVFHDDDLKRAAGVDLALRTLSRQQLSSHALFGTSARAPLLSEVLRAVDARVPIMLEIKHRGHTTEIAQAVHREIQDYRGALAVQSFNPFVVAWFRRRGQGIPLGQLGGPLADDHLALLERAASRRLLTLVVSRPDFLNYDLRALPDRWVSCVVACTGLPLLCWTIRTDSDRSKAERLRLNYVFEGIRP
jgi:glycerophosphoryl diester phosphodiesterase